MPDHTRPDFMQILFTFFYYLMPTFCREILYASTLLHLGVRAFLCVVGFMVVLFTPFTLGFFAHYRAIKAYSFIKLYRATMAYKSLIEGFFSLTFFYHRPIELFSTIGFLKRSIWALMHYNRLLPLFIFAFFVKVYRAIYAYYTFIFYAYKLTIYNFFNKIIVVQKHYFVIFLIILVAFYILRGSNSLCPLKMILISLFVAILHSDCLFSEGSILTVSQSASPSLKSQLLFRGSKVISRNYHTKKVDIESFNPIYDYNDPLLDKKCDTFYPIYIDDLDNFSRYTNLEVEQQKKVRDQVYGLNKWKYHDDFEIEINPAEEVVPTFNRVLPHIKSLLDSLEDNTVYKCMVVGLESFEIKTSDTSFFISKKTSADRLASRFIGFCTGIQMKYYDDEFISWKIAIKKWVAKEEINVKFDSLIDAFELQNSKNAAFFNGQKRNYPTYDSIDWLTDGAKNKCEFRAYDRITFGCYGKLIHKASGHCTYQFENYQLEVKRLGKDFSVILYKGTQVKAEWVDKYSHNAKWSRHFQTLGLTAYYEGDSYKHAEMVYNTSNWTPTLPENKYDNNIGSLDIETYTDNQGYGVAIPYAAGFRKITGEEELFYLENNQDPTDMICKLLNRLLQPENDGWLFYVHNLARFDSRFLLAALGRLGLKPRKLLGRAINQIFFISLRKKIGGNYVTVNLTDSIYILSASLDNLAKKFGTENKGVFPYTFVNANNLEYKGEMPPLKFYNKIDHKEYQKLAINYTVTKPWSMKEETLKYLSQDLICLINVMSTFNKSIFDKYQVNTTKVRSYSALSKLVYTTKYYKETGVKIPVISGYIEKIIRKGYYGGLVDVVEHLVQKAYKYDANSHYPAAMINDMPIGNPVISDEKDINKLFGFSYAKVTAPSVDILAQPTLPFRDSRGVTTCPRGRFEGVWFTEELKDSISRGYQVEIVSTVVFKRGKGLFDKFINNLFASKAKAKEEGDSVGELVYKLLMNSFYGKCGQLEIENTYTMVDNKNLEDFGRKHNYDLSQEFDKLTLVRENGRFVPALLELLNCKKDLKEETSLINKKSLEKNKKLPDKDKKGVKSCVAIAAAITAYARISLNRFKNIPGNKYLGGDTDSVIMQNPLPEIFVGKQLGMMKFEDDITLGLYADKKLYYAVNSQGYENIKSRGVGKDFNRKDILKLPHFLLMLAGHVVTVNKTKFVITKKGAVEIKKVSLDTKIQKNTYKDVLTELGPYLANNRHPKFLISRYISSLRNISDSQRDLLLNTDSKNLLKLLDIKHSQEDGVNNNDLSKSLSVVKESQSLGLTIYKAKFLKLIVIYPRVSDSTPEKKHICEFDPPYIWQPPGPGKW